MTSSNSWGTAFITAVNPQNGGTKWNHVVATGGAFTINKPVFGADGTVYISSLYGTAYCFAFNPQNGSTKWLYTIDDALKIAGPFFD